MKPPIFIVSSGRSGTAALARVLNAYNGVEFHHEYLCTHVQPLAFKFYHGLIDIKQAVDGLWKIHGAAYHYTDSEIWGDSSNKLSWLAQPLDWLFPASKFVQVVRDGRKVTSSFFNKLGDEIYFPDDLALMDMYVQNMQWGNNIEPPPEKRYWWNIPPNPDVREQFKNICWHWVNSHKEIETSFEQIEDERKRTFKLENLVSDPAVFEELVRFCGLEYEHNKFDMLKRPHNVTRPIDYPLSKEQSGTFWSMCRATMGRYGYAEDEYYEMRY